MNWIKIIFEVNDVYKPLIPLGIILVLVNSNGNSLVYYIAVLAIIVGIFGLFIKNRWTRLIAAILFAATGSFIVLSFYTPYLSYFGIFGGILVVLLAAWIIIAGIIAIYRAIVDDEEFLYEDDQVFDNDNVEDYYDEYDEKYMED